MDRDHLRFGLKLTAIALGAVVVTWFGNAPIASRWERLASDPPEVEAVADPAAAEVLRRRIFDGLVAEFATAGIEAWWRLEDEVVRFGYRAGDGPCACRITLVFPAGGLAPWSRLEGADERWLPWWPCTTARAEAEVWLARVEAAHRRALAPSGQ